MDKRSRLMPILSLSLVVVSCARIGQTGEPGVAASKNPFKDAAFFLNPDYAEKVLATAEKHPDMAEAIRKVAKIPTAVWLDTIESTKKLKGWLDEAKKQQDASGRPTVSLVVVYDLPNRDCSAFAAAGELKVADRGLERYKSEFIDPIAAELKAHPDQPIVIVLEPDSLPNLATNLNFPMCQEARPAYKSGTAYAIKSFALPNVSVYLDAAHAGWLGWDDNRAKAAKVFREVVNEAGGPHLIRGFATNVANYNHLTNNDGKALEPSDPCPNELSYVDALRKTLQMYGFKDHHFIVDTSRNGKGQIRTKWGSFCNIRGAGLGERPRADPMPWIDAYVWVKPPGESDGVSDPSAPRFDKWCAGPDAMLGAPQGGQWFEAHFVDMVRNAQPPLLPNKE